MKRDCLAVLPVVVALVLAVVSDASRAAAGEDAVIAVQTSVNVERAMLQEDTLQYDQLSARRARALDRLAGLYRSLDVAVKRTDSGGPAAVRSLIEQIDDAEQARAAMLATERILVDRIGERVRRIGILEAEVAALSDQSRKDVGRLTGSWDVTLLPLDQKGRFEVTQTGTLLSGTYTLEGGWNGSLQGTLVNRKVYLVRIDSKLGRSMELEGLVTGDGKRIKGTWLNYELAGQEGSAGQWSAVRVVQEP